MSTKSAILTLLLGKMKFKQKLLDFDRIRCFTPQKTQSFLRRNCCDVPDSLQSLFQWLLKSVDHCWHWGGVQDSLRLPHLRDLKTLVLSDANLPTHYTHESSAEWRPCLPVMYRRSPHRCRDGHQVWNTIHLTCTLQEVNKTCLQTTGGKSALNHDSSFCSFNIS